MVKKIIQLVDKTIVVEFDQIPDKSFNGHFKIVNVDFVASQNATQKLGVTFDRRFQSFKKLKNNF